MVRINLFLLYIVFILPYISPKTNGLLDLPAKEQRICMLSLHQPITLPTIMVMPTFDHRLYLSPETSSLCPSSAHFCTYISK